MKINELAELLHVHRNSVSALINNNRKLTTEMAFRLAKVFDTTVDFWLNLQAAVDLWEVENNMRTREELGRIETVAEYLARREERAKRSRRIISYNGCATLKQCIRNDVLIPSV